MFPSNDVGDRNLENLLAQAYRPEAPEPGFLRETEDKLLAAARTQAARRALEKYPAPPPADLQRLRRRLGWAMALAASVAVAFLVHYAGRPSPRPALLPLPEPQAAGKKEAPAAPPARLVANWRDDVFGLTPRQRPAEVKTPPAAVGSTLTTPPGERRRFALDDGTIVYLNQDTEVQVTASRRLELTRGEIYLEVAPRPDSGATFRVQAPGRAVVALGTRFAVRADAAGSGVVVTQGKVRIDGVAGDVGAGMRVAPGGTVPLPAERASHLLDWTRDLMAEACSPLVPNPKHGGGALVAIDPYGQEINLTLRKYHVDVHIEDGFARTTIDQTYFNNTWGRLEGTFYFPLPPDASLSRLAMYVEQGDSCVLMEGGMAERDHARNVYETILHQRRDPALLEWVDGSTFKMRVFPLEGRKEKRIILSYTQRVPSLYGATQYRFPGGHDMQVVNDWSFAARVKHGAEWRVTSESHPKMTIRPEGGDMVLAAAERTIKPHRDVTVEIYEGAGPARGDEVRFASAVHENHRYLMLRYRPQLETEPKPQRRDWVVLFETGADRDPLVARTQIEALRGLFENAEHDDTFVLATANTRLRFFDEKPQSLTPENLAAALKFLDQAHLIGALDLGNALDGLKPHLQKARVPHLLHLGGGVPALGETADDVLLRKVPDGTRYVGIAVGKRWNRTFLKGAADRTGGFWTQINPDEKVAWRAFEALATLNTPRLADLKVVDAAEKAVFLTDTIALAQGEEVAAMTRVEGDAPLPEKVVVSGKLDGKPFVRELPVRNVAPGANYLPRSWAKLEIDRLLADGAAKHQKTITALSMAMYVMSPFTSLLVLETEEDYKRFKVDRGRKDHWALYPCPDRIPVVFEPDPNQQAWVQPRRDRDPAAKLAPEQVLASILVRPLPPLLVDPQRGHPGHHQALTAWQMVQMASQVRGKLQDPLVTTDIDPGFSLETFTRSRPDSLMLGIGTSTEPTLDLTTTPTFTSSAPGPMGNRTIFTRGGFGNGGFGMPAGQPMPMDELAELRLKDLPRRTNLQELATSRGWLGDRLILTEDLESRLGELDFREEMLNESREAERLDRFSLLRAERELIGRDGLRRIQPMKELTRSLEQLVRDQQVVRAQTESVKRLTKATEEIHGIAGRLLGRRAQPQLLYSRPAFVHDGRILADLTRFAPALHAGEADILAALDREAKDVGPPRTGRIDVQAQKLIDAARARGWQQVMIPAADGRPAFRVVFDGRGRFAFERTLPLGLKERVVCDGKTLRHLYEEIGLGARRDFTPHHEGLLGSLVPWYLPPAADLAQGVDLVCIDDRTVALQAHPRPGTDPEKETKKDPAPAKSWQVRLVFAPDGRLAERQVVELPEAKVLYRIRYETDGKVRLIEEKDGKVHQELDYARTEAEAPELAPETKHLLMLRLPLRTMQHVWNRVTNWTGHFANVDKQWAEEAFVADCFAGNSWRALQCFGECFHVQGDRRLGFYVLLSSVGFSFNRDQEYSWGNVRVKFRPEEEHPDDPLAQYLALDIKARHQGSDRFEKELPANAPVFLRRLLEFRHLWYTWTSGNAGRDQQSLEAARQRTLKFVRDNDVAVLDWALLELLQRQGHRGDARFMEEVVRHLQSSGDQLGLGWSARYEIARSLRQAGKNAEARKLYETLYREAFDKGTLPPIDADFRQSFLPNSGIDDRAFGRFVRGIHADLVGKKAWRTAVVLAWQMHQVGEAPLAEELLADTLQLVPEQERGLAQLAAVEFLWQSGQAHRADALLHRVLDSDRDLAGRSALWRLASSFAFRLGLTAKGVACLEKAMDMEFERLPLFVDLQVVRNDYRGLLTHYRQLATALTILEAKAPREFLAKVVRAADRWRSLDPDHAEPCTLAAGILKHVGARELAWDYLTTPIGRKPNEAQPWLQLAQAQIAEAEYELADRAYAAAFRAEATNAQILWDRARNLQNLGRMEDARALYRQLAEGEWQPRFQWLKTQAQQHLR